MIPRALVVITASACILFGVAFACAPPGQAESAGVSVLQRGLTARLSFLAEEEESAAKSETPPEDRESAGGAATSEVSDDALAAGGAAPASPDARPPRSE